MLDRYIYGQVSRISPEAPVPVVLVEREKYMPGGACNVSSNIRSLGGRATISGIAGADEAGEKLCGLLREEGVSSEGILSLTDRKTTLKTRIIADRQQVCRVDWDDEREPAEHQIKAFCDLVEREVGHATAVIIEDYGKGVVQQEIVDTVLRSAATSGIPTGFDPKDNHMLNVAGVTVATPNRREAFIGAGMPEGHPAVGPLDDDPLIMASEALLEKWSPELLLVTLGAQGMLLRSGASASRHVPTRAREVFDVSGAGDTVIAACVLALSAGATFEEAAELANYAAGVVVGKLGTATCTAEELLTHME